MLSKQHRFQREHFPTGKPFKKQTFSWGSVFLYHLPAFKGAVIVSKKALKKAHDRNRAKRRLYAFLNEYTDKNIGVLIRLRKEALTEDKNTIAANLSGVIKG